MKILGVLVLGVLISIVEIYLVFDSFQGAKPFPWNEVLYMSADHIVRDILVLAIGVSVYIKRKSLLKSIKEFFPVAVIGVLYLCAVTFMLYRLSLDFGLQTFLSVLAGVCNNVLIVLISALIYHKWKNKTTKWLYLISYVFTGLVIIADIVYFWQTTTHVESVLFQNLNIYSIIAVINSFDTSIVIALLFVTIAVICLFKTVGDKTEVVNFKKVTSIILGAALLINVVDYACSIAGMYAIKRIVGMYAVVESEKVRYNYRSMISVPINVNFLVKALNSTDSINNKYYEFAKDITKKDKKLLADLGIEDVNESVEKLTAQYDKVVMLILESVHRDYINYYNRNIPEAATTFLNSLIIKYPHIDKFYSSAVPTTQGLNAIFRSHIIMDKSLSGRNTPSIFRCAQQNGARGIFLNASTQYYADELREYPEQFGMQEYYAREYLDTQGYIGASGWGYHNDVIYDEAIKLLDKYRNEKVFLVAKTLDMHQPYPYVGCEWEELPKTVQAKGSITVNGMYWVDMTLRNFFNKVEQLGLMDERTLYVITSDHNPHSGGEYLDLVPNTGDKFSIAPIPLIFVSKNLLPLNNLRNNVFASQIDLAPTLLHLLGIEKPSLFMGRNLLELRDKTYALGYFGGNFYYWSDGVDFIGELNKKEYDNDYVEVINKYILNNYALWHK